MSPANNSSRALFVTFLVFSSAMMMAVADTERKHPGNPGNSLQNQLDKMSRRLDQIDNEMNNVKYRLSNLEKYKPDTSYLEKKINGMDVSVKHLEKVNQIWKSNFRSIRDTFSKLREKITFTQPQLNF